MNLQVSLRSLTLTALSATSVIANDAIPQPLPADRYDAMSEQSPFALASPAAPVAAPEAPSFATNWFVTGIGRLNDDDYVTIKARDLSVQFSLFGREPNPQTGVMLASVNWSDTIGKSTVVLRKGTETAVLEFNEADMQAASVSSNSGPSHTRVATPKIPITTGINPQPMRQAVPPARPPSYVATSGPKVIRPSGLNVVPPPTVNRPPNSNVPGGNLPQNARRRGPQINAPR